MATNALSKKLQFIQKTNKYRIAKRITASATQSVQIDKKNDNNSAKDDLLTRMAIEEIYKETAKGAIRAEQAGPSGWQPCPLRKTNKRFLNTTIKSVLCHNQRQTQQQNQNDPKEHAKQNVSYKSEALDSKTSKRKKTEEELDEIIARGKQRTAKFGDRKHRFRKVSK